VRTQRYTARQLETTRVTQTHSCRTLSVTIARAPADVYGYVSNPQNLPEWATSFCRAVGKDTTGGWVADTKDGPVGIRFVEANLLGVLDHYVRLRSGEETFSPMRVVQNGEGSELFFTLFRLPRVSDEQFAQDLRLIERDLLVLKNRLEDDGAPRSAG
jgi:hypothetical protein